MRILISIFFLALAAGQARAQDVLKMVDGSKKEVQLIRVGEDKVFYAEPGDPLTIEHDMPKTRVLKIIHKDGRVEAMRPDYSQETTATSAVDTAASAPAPPPAPAKKPGKKRRR